MPPAVSVLEVESDEHPSPELGGGGGQSAAGSEGQKTPAKGALAVEEETEDGEKAVGRRGKGKLIIPTPTMAPAASQRKR